MIKKIFLNLLIIFLVSCVSDERIAELNRIPEGKVCVFLLDGSGSYDYSDAAKNFIVNKIEKLSFNSIVYVRWIIRESFSDDANIIKYKIPYIKEPQKFDAKAQIEYKQLQKKIDEEKDLLIRKIKTTEFPHSCRTDIYGSLAAAIDRFSQHENNEKELFILSDLDDNIKNQNLKINFSGIAVKINGVEIKKISDRERINDWLIYFKNNQAESVTVSYIEDLEGL